MNFDLSTGFAAVTCLLLASCYPVNDKLQDKPVTKAPEKSVTTQDPLKLKEEEALKQQQQEALAQQNPVENPATPSTPPTEKPKAAAEPKRDYEFANKIPGKDGFVLSPYNQKVIDVRDIPSGTLVQDPTYPAAEKKYFRVP